MEPLIGHHTSTKSTSGLITCASLLTLASIVLYIVATSTTSIIHTEGLGPIKTANFRGDFGPFRLCYSVSDSTTCKDIDRDCKVSFGDTIKFSGAVVDDCDAWNAGRAFLVIGIIAGASAFLVQLIIACAQTDASMVRVLAVLLGLIAMVSGIISMSVYARLRDRDDAFQSANSSKLDYGFYCILVGWVLAFFACIPFCATRSKYEAIL
jgi:hypothetical protein